MSKGTARVKNTLVRFHNEIIDFMNFVAPSKDEHLKREEAFAR
jgi:non-canonical poly(A) RNA polymerase PAPD5/7